MQYGLAVCTHIANPPLSIYCHDCLPCIYFHPSLNRYHWRRPTKMIYASEQEFRAKGMEKADSITAEAQCCHCLARLSPEVYIAKLPCGHILHWSCMVDHLQHVGDSKPNYNKCPRCFAILFRKPVKQPAAEAARIVALYVARKLPDRMSDFENLTGVVRQTKYSELFALVDLLFLYQSRQTSPNYMDIVDRVGKEASERSEKEHVYFCPGHRAHGSLWIRWIIEGRLQELLMRDKLEWTLPGQALIVDRNRRRPWFCRWADALEVLVDAVGPRPETGEDGANVPSQTQPGTQSEPAPGQNNAAPVAAVPQADEPAQEDNERQETVRAEGDADNAANAGNSGPDPGSTPHQPHSHHAEGCNTDVPHWHPDGVHQPGGIPVDSQAQRMRAWQQRLGGDVDWVAVVSNAIVYQLGNGRYEIDSISDGSHLCTVNHAHGYVIDGVYVMFYRYPNRQ
ncbi:hypothetical protein BDV96DRAFT_281089 [Lophiotrema nucula]|uniref:RING-type domain-containing protein n=1 Tax=Lophiotrema nucula TaxID=690887 RepID=A0A6A5ZMM9_9PLEO|nr:hypothetical protein BDV96DRAFT_281089 [Lophiotrema nucula]